MKHDITKYLTDILLSIEKIKKYIGTAKDLSEYEADDELKDAVERRLAIIGEALYQANKHNSALPVSHKERIIALRHILVHDYDSINQELIWSIVQTHLENLSSEVAAILNKI